MIGIENVVVSTQHSADAENDTIRSFITEEIIKPSLPTELLSSSTEYLINPTGRFVIGGPEEILALQEERLSSILTVDGVGTEVELSPEKIQAKLIVLLPTCADGWPRMLWLLGLLIVPNYRLHMQLVILIQQA